MPVEPLQHDRCGFPQMLQRSDPVAPTRAQQPHNVPDRTHGFGGDPLDALELVRGPTPTLGKIREHLDASEIASHFIMQITCDAFADLEQLSSLADAIADGEENQEKGADGAGEHNGPGAEPFPSPHDRVPLVLQTDEASLQLPTPVKQTDPLGDGNDFPIRSETVRQTLGTPVSPPRSNHISHAIRASHPCSKGMIDRALQHLDLAQCTKGGIGVEGLPESGHRHPHEADSLSFDRENHRIVAGIRQGKIETRGSIQLVPARGDNDLQLLRKSESARQIRCRSLGRK